MMTRHRPKTPMQMRREAERRANPRSSQPARPHAERLAHMPAGGIECADSRGRARTR
jgi:hypothetical protein